MHRSPYHGVGHGLSDAASTPLLRDDWGATTCGMQAFSLKNATCTPGLFFVFTSTSGIAGKRTGAVSILFADLVAQTNQDFSQPARFCTI